MTQGPSQVDAAVPAVGGVLSGAGGDEGLDAFRGKLAEAQAGPELAEQVEPGSVELMDKETFTDAVAGDHDIVDLLARVRVRGLTGCVLVHVEPQARDSDIKKFPQRIFRYFAGLELGPVGRYVKPPA